MKCVIVIAEDLPSGLAANACAVLAMSFGQSYPELVGEDVPDGNSDLHTGITKVTLPILKAKGSALESLRSRLVGSDGIYTVDFTDIAQKSRHYGDYAETLLKAVGPIEYVGILAYGPRKSIDSVTGSLPLYR